MYRIFRNIIFILIFTNLSLFANENLKKVSIQLNWKFQFEYAGFIMANEKGFYKDAGFDVELKEFNNDTKTIKDVLEGKSTFSLTDGLLMIERQAHDIVLLANYYKQSPLIIATNTSVKHPKDLENKSLMSSKERLVNTPIDFMFRHLNIDIDKIKFKTNTYNIQELIDNNTDAMEVYKTNEIYKLKAEKIPHNILDPKDFGFNSGAVNMFTSQKVIDKYGKQNIQKFITATNKGWEYALNNIDETINLIYTNYNDSLKKTKDALLFEANETKKLFLLDQFKIGEINKEELYRWYDILNNYALIEKYKRFDNFLFNDTWKEKSYTKDELYVILIMAILIIAIILILVYFYKLKAKILEEKNAQIADNLHFINILFNSTLEGVVISDSLGNCIDANDSTLNILGLKSKDEIIGKKIYKYIADDSKDLVRSNIENKYNKPYEINLLRNNKSFPVYLKGTTIEHNGEMMRISAFVDISDLKSQELKLLKSEKMASMGEMIGNIAHQWRQPLSIISSGATGMKVQKQFGELNDEVFEKTCDTINNNAQYLSQTIDDFRNFIKNDRQLSTFKIKDTIDSFLNLVQPSFKKYNIELELNVDESIDIEGYENELIQCMMNIFNNSKDALKDLDIRSKVIIIDVYKNENVIIKFTDNAGGIKDEILPRIFEPYFTTKHKSQGTGLGLSMTYSLIVEGMKGNIEASNVSYEYDDIEYKGAQFKITLA